MIERNEPSPARLYAEAMNACPHCSGVNWTTCPREALENGYEVHTRNKHAHLTIPWEKPWNTLGSAPQSVHGKRYRGFNAMWLDFVQNRQGYKDCRWITYNQAKKQGGQVRKGEKSQAVTLWMQSYNHQSSCPVRKSKVACDNIGRGKCQRYMLLRYYSVFNVEQVDGLDLKPLPVAIENDFDPIEAAEQVVNDYLERENISLINGSAAYYTPSLDQVTVPEMKTFRTIESYYSTLFHECGHSTGHESRLNRKDNKQN